MVTFPEIHQCVNWLWKVAASDQVAIISSRILTHYMRKKLTAFPVCALDLPAPYFILCTGTKSDLAPDAALREYAEILVFSLRWERNATL